MPALTPIVRTSLKTPLADRYNASQNLANVGGGSAKDTGTNRADMINPTTQGIKSDFTEFAKTQVTTFTPSALDYAKTLGVNTTPYK